MVPFFQRARKKKGFITHGRILWSPFGPTITWMHDSPTVYRHHEFERHVALVGAVSAKQLKFRVRKEFRQFSREKAQTAGSDFLFGPNYIGIRGCVKLKLLANMFYWATIYFHFGA